MASCPALQQEIERLNQRRAEREKEAILREQEQMQQMRFAESAQMAAWIDKEDDFHLEQAKKRAEIRVRERRAKPIDYLALNLKWSQPPLEPGDEGYEEQEEEEDDGAGLEVDLEEPYAIFDVRFHLLLPFHESLHPLWLTSHATHPQHLALEDAEELHDDIKMYLSLEKVESHQEFWRALLIVSSATLEALREERSIGTSAYQAQTRANAAVKAEITRLLSGKSHDQLVQLQQQVQAKLASGEVIDVDYWEGLLKELVVQKAKAKLRDMHEVVLNNRLEQLRKKQRDEALRYAQEVKNAIFVPPPAEALERLDEEEEDMQIEEEEEEEGAATVAEKWDDKWEPVLHNRIPEECRACQVVDFAEDRQKLVRQRARAFLSLFFLRVLIDFADPLVTIPPVLHTLPSPHPHVNSTQPVAPLLRLASSLSRAPPPPPPVETNRRPTRTKRSTKRRSVKGSTRKKSFSTSRPRCRSRVIRGRTSTGRGSRGTSTKSTRVTSGTSTTRRTTSTSCVLLPYCLRGRD